MTLKYCKGEKINLCDYYDEKWLQEKIEEDPSLIGLGEVIVIQRERKQSTGGRIDFLLKDLETETMYEVEIQLGETDESHIIRTIEYWDVERRHNPSKKHKAVIIAEQITNRFFNVIELMNKSIPVIAIQLNAVKFEDKILLIFTKVLDTFEEEDEEEIPIGGENYKVKWEKYANLKSIALMEQLMAITKGVCPDQKVTYNKYHISLGTSRRNFAWFYPRKKEGYCYFDIMVGNENIEKVKESLQEAGIPFTYKGDDVFGFPMLHSVFDNHRDILEKLLRQSCELNK